MMNPMDHQTEAIRAIFSSYKRGARAPLFQLSTAGGKTVVCGIAAQIAEIAQTPVLMIAHRNNLVDQASETFERMGIDHGIINGGSVGFPDRLVNIGMVQTISRRLESIPKQGLIVIDEAHHCAGDNMWRRVSDVGKRVLGVTATPLRADGLGLGVSSGGVFDDLILGPPMDELIDIGRLVPMKYYGPSKIFDWKKISQKSSSDFTQDEMTVALEKSKIHGDAVKLWAKFAYGLKTITFCHSKAFANEVCDKFNGLGVSSIVITGDDTARQQKAKINSLASGSITNLIAIDVISEGTDIPCVYAGIGMRPTKSLNLIYQQVGRIMRSAPGKNHGIWIDMVGNIAYHGMIGTHKWALDYDNNMNVSTANINKGIVQIKTCEKCFELCMHNPCEHCGHQKIGRIIDVLTDAEYMEIKDREREEKNARAMQNNIEFLANILKKQQAKGYKIFWAMQVYKGRIGKFPSNSEISQAKKLF